MGHIVFRQICDGQKPLILGLGIPTKISEGYKQLLTDIWKKVIMRDHELFLHGTFLNVSGCGWNTKIIIV